jgi:hypothetical protein
VLYFDSDTSGTSPQTRYGLDAGPLGVFRAMADNGYFNPQGVPVSRN